MKTINTSIRPWIGKRRVFLLILLAMAVASDRLAFAQCPMNWRPGEGHPGVTGDLPVWALTAWDPDGAGPQPEVLVAGGGFQGAGNVPTFGIAIWDGADWHALGEGGGMNGQVFTLTVYQGEVIAAGDFSTAGGVSANRIARWDGAAWHPLGRGLNQRVRALAVYNGELYAGGFFTQAGDAPANFIARWNGSSWQSVGRGVNGAVSAFTVFEGTLVAGGGFTVAGDVPAHRFARWDGSAWQSMAGNGVERVSNVEAFAVYNGDLITAANFFTPSGLRSLSRWNGTTWQSIGTRDTETPNDAVFALSEYKGDLYVGGIFTSVGGLSTPNRLARWNGSSWSAVPSGPGTPAQRAQSFAQFHGDLIVGGLSTKPNGLQTSAVGRWDGSAWHYLGGGINSVVVAVTSYQGDLFVGGAFTHAGDVVVSSIARRGADGQWDPLMGGVSGGLADVRSMVVYEDTLVISGSFTAVGGVPANGIARWDGQSWQAFGRAFATNLLVHEGALYGSIGPGLVGQWNPLTQQWQPLGQLPPNVGITSFTVFDSELIAAGVGGVGAPAAVFRWDGITWHPMGGTMGFNTIEALIVYQGELLAGGLFDSLRGGPPGAIIRWTGSDWQTLGGGLYDEDPEHFTIAVWDMIVFNGDLIVAGQFSHAGEPFGVPSHNIVRWNGSSWSGLGTGTNDQVVALGEHEGDLILGGWFTMAGGAPNGHWARWGPVCPQGNVPATE